MLRLNRHQPIRACFKHRLQAPQEKPARALHLCTPWNETRSKDNGYQTKTVGIRVPSHPIAKLLLETLGNPIVNTSVQLEDDDAILAEPFEIEEYIGNRIDLIIDAGAIYPDPSSLIDLTGDYPEILREGKGDVTPFR